MPDLKVEEPKEYKHKYDQEFLLPTLDGLDLETFHIHDLDPEPLPAIELLSSVHPSASSKTSPAEVHRKTRELPIEEDIWLEETVINPPPTAPRLLTWDSFYNPNSVTPAPAFLSEAGPAVFDVALRQHAGASPTSLEAGRVLQSDAFLRSLWELGLGRSSVLFPLDIESVKFVQAIEDGKLSGYSHESTQSIVEEFLRLGTAMVELTKFHEAVYKRKNALSALVALADAASVAQQAVEMFLVQKERSIGSLLQLQDTFEPVKDLVFAMQDMIQAVGTASANQEVVGVVFEKIQALESQGYGQYVFAEVLRHVSKPWFDEIAAMVGLRPSATTPMVAPAPTGTLPFSGDVSLLSQHPPNTTKLPEFITEEQQQLIEKTRDCLGFMRNNDPDHPLCNISQSTTTPDLDWALTWDDVDRISQKATAFQAELQLLISSFESGSKTPMRGDKHPEPELSNSKPLDATVWPTDIDPEQLEASIALLSGPLQPSILTLPTSLLHTMTSILTSPPTPPTSASHLPLSLHLTLTPTLNTLHTLLTTSTLRTIILTQNITTHFHLLHSFYLFGCGTFTSNLALVLFSSDLTPAERQRGTLRAHSGGGLGLKIGSGERRDWPPTSSELMLALRGLLGDAWRQQAQAIPTPTPKPNPLRISHSGTAPVTGDQHHHPSTLKIDTGSDSTLPGNLSFSLRAHLTEPEIQRILNVDTIYALDFLRLTYQPPKALEAVFNSVCLEMYDRISRWGLRLLRMGFVREQLYQDIMVLGRGRGRGLGTNKGAGQEVLVNRFRWEATHFIDTITSYTTLTAIGRPWREFTSYIAALEEYVRGRQANVSGRHATASSMPSQQESQRHYDFSLKGLITAHEDMLRTMTSALLLRRKQKKMADALEEVFNTILGFAKLVKERARQFEKEVVGGEIDSDTVDVRELYAEFQRKRQGFVEACKAVQEKRLFSSGSRDRDGAVGGEGDVGKMLEELIARLADV